jgi:hypothetical protein
MVREVKLLLVSFAEPVLSLAPGDCMELLIIPAPKKLDLEVMLPELGGGGGTSASSDRDWRNCPAPLFEESGLAGIIRPPWLDDLMRRASGLAWPRRLAFKNTGTASSKLLYVSFLPFENSKKSSLDSMYLETKKERRKKKVAKRNMRKKKLTSKMRMRTAKVYE